MARIGGSVGGAVGGSVGGSVGGVVGRGVGFGGRGVGLGDGRAGFAVVPFEGEGSTEVRGDGVEESDELGEGSGVSVTSATADGELGTLEAGQIAITDRKTTMAASP